MEPTLFIILATTTSMPLIVFFAIMAFTRRYPIVSAVMSIFSAVIATSSAVFFLILFWHSDQTIEVAWRWVGSGDLVVPFGFLLDPLSLLMFTVVAVICLLVQIYSLGYMSGDPGFSRYFAFMSLFAWAMMNLSLASNMLQLYIFWELVGLSSYLLIGFWIERFSATEAGKKAFVMTRLGDVAFFLGLLLAFAHLGSLTILDLNDPHIATGVSPTILTWSAVLIFGGIVGKSAQFPLLTWLPDAMEGPTPVSALLHSATMVAAGVFLFARLFPFFSLSPTAMAIFLLIGTISMLLASTMALATRDIKQIWAYSTISQLGFMIMGLAAGQETAGVFHLTTHAGFKALLFLCSGVFIHALGSNDIFDIGTRGGRRMRIPLWCLIIAAAALAGLPPTSGFFSKEVILGALAEHHQPVWLIAGLLGAFLTAYYAFRVIFVIAFPRQAESSTGHHDHKSAYAAMAGPLIVLAGATLLLGFAQPTMTHAFSSGAPGHAAHHSWLPYTAIAACLVGIALAWFEFGRRGARQIGFVDRLPAIHRLFAQRWYLDWCYRRLLDAVVYGLLSKFCMTNDQKVIDGGIDALSHGTVGAGRIISRIHNVMIQYRILAMFIAIALLLVFLFF